MKSITTDSTAHINTNLLKAPQRPQQKMSKEELAEKRRLGLCYKCNDKWSKTHLCPNQSLQVLTVVNGYEMEVLDDLREEMSDEDVEFTGELMELSLNSFLGLSSPTTTKMIGCIKKHQLVVMLDSGATHNFIAPSVVQKAHLKTEENHQLEVLLGIGVTVKGLGVCPVWTSRLVIHI